MATEDRVVIHVEIDVDSLGDLAKVTAAMKAIEAQEKRINRQTNVMESGLKKLEGTTKRLGKTLDVVKNGFSAFFRIFGKFNFIGMAAEIGLVSLALAGVKVALVAGRFAIKAYQVALQGLGVAAVAAAGAIGTVAAALNEFQQVSLFPLLGSFRASASAVRGVMGDSLLSFFGQEGLTGAIENLSKSGQIAASTFPSILRGLGNFAKDGKQLAQLAEIFSTITAEGKLTSSTLGGLTSINPVFASAIAEISSGNVLKGEAATKIAEQSAAAGEISAQEFSRVFSGELESTNLWEGQLERLNNTLIGQLKGLVVRMGALFVDLGRPFLEPLKSTLMDIELIVQNTIIRLRGAVTQFGLESFLPGLLGTVESIADFVVRMANEGVPKIVGIMERVKGFFDSMENFFRNIGAILGPLEKGADAMLTLFGPFFSNIFGAKGFGGLIMDAAEGFEANAGAMERMGQALGDLAFSFMGLFRDLQDSFFSGSDEITEFLTVLTVDVMPVIREMAALWRDMFREALPTINRLLHEASKILLPILNMIQSIMGALGGGVGAAVFAGLLGGKMGLSVPSMMGAGLGGSLGGLPGAILGGLGISKLTKGIAARGGMGALLAGGGKHAGATSLASFLGLSGPALGLGAVSGIGGFAGASALNKNFGAGGGITTNVGAMGAGGVLAGAGVGALIGSVVPVIGTAVGAIVGGIAGGIGAALGTASGNATREKAKDWIMEQMDAVTGEISRMLDKGLNRAGITEGRKAIQELLDPANVKSMAQQLKLSEREIRSILEDTSQGLKSELDSREKNLTKSLDYITEAFGMTEDQVLELADIMAIDLSDSFATLISDLTGLELILGPEGIAGAVQAIGEQSTLEALFGPGSVLGQRQASEQAASMREELNGLLDVFASDASAGTLQEMLTLAQGIAQLDFGEKGTELLFRANDLLNQLIDPTSSGYVGAEQAALASQVQQKDVEPMIRALENGTHAIYDPIKGQLEALHALSGDDQFQWGNFFQNEILPKVAEGGGFAEASIERVLEGFSLETAAFALEVTGAGNEFSADVMSSATYLSSSIMAAGDALTGKLSRVQLSVASMTQAREAGSPPPPPGKKDTTSRFTRRTGDTATSRMRRVMGFHSSLSKRIGGKFGVTSGMRDFALGSLNSDHLTGGAIDVVGDNLGQYAAAVRGMGGFAEFHGSSGSRHLHAVPPIGDTSAPANLKGGGGAVINANFSINGAGDPEAVAEVVMTKLNKLMRDEEERR